MYDLIIVGLGAAGISAAIYAKRSNLKVLCLEKGMPGGIINYIDKRLSLKYQRFAAISQKTSRCQLSTVYKKIA